MRTFERIMGRKNSLEVKEDTRGEEVRERAKSRRLIQRTSGEED